MKNTLLFTYSTNILARLLTVNVKNFFYPKNPKMCDAILVTLLKMQRHYSQSSRENATPSSGTSPLASYKEVPPPALYYLFWKDHLVVKTSFKPERWNYRWNVQDKRAFVDSFSFCVFIFRTWYDTKDNAGLYRFIPGSEIITCYSRLFSFLYIVFYWNSNLSCVLASLTVKKKVKIFN